MIEGIFILAALVAACIAVFVMILQGLIGLGPRLRARSRLKHAPYGIICMRCNHILNMLDRRTIRSYDQGKCPSCGMDLMRMEKP